MYTDEAVSKLRQVDSEPFVIVNGVSSTGHIRPNLAGKAGKFEFRLLTEKDESLFSVTIKLNKSKAFEFNVFRAMMVFLIVFLGLIIYVTPYWEEALQVKKGVTKIMLCMLVSVEIIFMIILAWAGTKEYPVFSENTNPTDVYQELTVALSQGKTDLNGLIPETKDSEQQGIQQLEQLDNPYEWSQRYGIDYKWDRAFYKGKYYCYFGIIPVLFYYLPCYLLTGKLLNTYFLAILLVMCSAVVMTWLVYNIAKRRKREVNVWLIVCAAAGFLNCSMVLSCIAPSNFYEVAKLSALCLSLLGINLIYTAFDGKIISALKLLFGALFMAMAVGCRPNFIFASFVVLPIVLKGLEQNNSNALKEKSENQANILLHIKNIFNKKNVSYIICFTMPYIVIGLFLMYYNYIRFGSIFEFGAKYQLTVYDTSYYSVTDLGKLPVALYRGLFMMPDFSSEFPFINPVSEVSHYMGYFYRMPGMGVFVYPIMWLMIMLPWSLKRGIKRTGDGCFVSASVVMGLFSCFITTAVGGSSLGYSVDFAWLLYIPIVYVIFDLYEYSKKKRIEKYIFIILLALTSAAVIMNMLSCFSSKSSDIASNCPELFYGLQKMIIFWR